MLWTQKMQQRLYAPGGSLRKHSRAVNERLYALSLSHKEHFPIANDSHVRYALGT
jgi:hypothetical protein